MNRRKLLIADDSEMNRAMLANMLDHDFQIIEAVDGHETISALEMYEGEIAALLLDIVMPEMDGFQVLEEMQRRGWTESVPTIMISAETGSAYIDRAFELGASDYINRPFTTGIIRRRIINAILLHTKKQQLIDIVSNYSYRHEKNTEEMVSILSSAVEHRCCGGGRHMAGVGYLTGLLLRCLLAREDVYKRQVTDGLNPLLGSFSGSHVAPLPILVDTHHHFRQNIGNCGNSALTSILQRFQDQRIVAGKDGEVLRILSLIHIWFAPSDKRILHARSGTAEILRSGKAASLI